MSFVYVTEHGATIGIDGGHITIKHQDKETDEIPKELVEGISVFGKSQLTAATIQHCLENNVRVSFFSINGKFYGSLTPTYKNNISRIRKQIELFADEAYILELSKRIVRGKINNQITVANYC